MKPTAEQIEETWRDSSAGSDLQLDISGKDTVDPPSHDDFSSLAAQIGEGVGKQGGVAIQ